MSVRLGITKELAAEGAALRRYKSQSERIKRSAKALGIIWPKVDFNNEEHRRLIHSYIDVSSNIRKSESRINVLTRERAEFSRRRREPDLEDFVIEMDDYDYGGIISSNIVTGKRSRRE